MTTTSTPGLPPVEDGYLEAHRVGCAERWFYRPTEGGYALRVWNSMSNSTSAERPVHWSGIVLTTFGSPVIAPGAPLPESPVARAGARAGDTVLATILADGTERRFSRLEWDRSFEGAVGLVVARDTGRQRKIHGGGSEPVKEVLKIKWE